MNKQNIINKFNKQKKHIPRMLLSDGGVVIGEEVDELNRLHYVIKNGNRLTVEYAGKVRPITNFIKKSGITITIDQKKVDEIIKKI